MTKPKNIVKGKPVMLLVELLTSFLTGWTDLLSSLLYYVHKEQVSSGATFCQNPTTSQNLGSEMTKFFFMTCVCEGGSVSCYYL